MCLVVVVVIYSCVTVEDRNQTLRKTTISRKWRCKACDVMEQYFTIVTARLAYKNVFGVFSAICRLISYVTVFVSTLFELASQRTS